MPTKIPRGANECIKTKYQTYLSKAKSWIQQIGTLAHWQISTLAISTLSLPLHRENTHPLVFKSTTVPWQHRDSCVYTCL